MKCVTYITRRAIILLLLLPFSFFALAQQTFFSVPSGEITKENKAFYQIQTNIFDTGSAEAKFDFSYGLAEHWEMGLNIETELEKIANQGYGLMIEDHIHHKALTPLVLLNTQKCVAFLPKPKMHLNVGAQVGTNFIHTGTSHLAYGVYTSLATNVLEKGHMNIGIKAGNQVLLGQGNITQIFGGFEIPFSERWAVMADATLGTTQTTMANLGFTYLPSKHIQLCLGAITPMPKNPVKEYGVVFELSIFAWDKEKD